MKAARTTRVLAAAALTLVLASAPLSASAATYHPYWGGNLYSWATKTSGTTTMSGAYTGGTNAINITYLAQTVTPYGIYGSAETVAGTATLQHGSKTLQARCFHRPFSTAGPATNYLSCSYIK